MDKFYIIKFCMKMESNDIKYANAALHMAKKQSLQQLGQIHLSKDFTVSLASLSDVVRHRQVWYHLTPRELGNQMSLNLSRTETIKPVWPRRQIGLWSNRVYTKK